MELLDKIASREAKIGVIGLGYVGLPLVIEFHKAGFQVTGFDIDDKKVTALREQRCYIKHIDIAPLFAPPPDASPASHGFQATSDFSLLTGMDAILICVPTPLNKNREPDMTYVFNTAKMIGQYLREGQLIILESTTYPGTTDEDMRAILEKSGLKAGKDFCLAFSPEREDPANKHFNLRTTPKVVGGFSATCLKAAKALYDTVVDRTVPVSSTRAAEATKLLENIYRAVNIALVNEMKMLFDKMDIDIWEVIEAAGTKPFGFHAFYPGPGLGGHCIPIDPFYLTWKAREYDFATRFIELAGEINRSMPDYVVGKIAHALNEINKTVKGSRILVAGLAYKADVDDDRESPSYAVMAKLEAKGAFVFYNDPYFPSIRQNREFPQFAGRTSTEITSKFDLVVILTPHDRYRTIDFGSLGIPIVDTRNIVKKGNPMIYPA
ncbi:MAG TPA: nucleotide sugar dehydrogenase [Syntrophorhabdaceae bacterium]